jgi:hypothetical protein
MLKAFKITLGILAALFFAWLAVIAIIAVAFRCTIGA